jgi:hypothetical protein
MAAEAGSAAGRDAIERGARTEGTLVLVPIELGTIEIVEVSDALDAHPSGEVRPGFIFDVTAHS